MSDAFFLIRTLGKEGKSAADIARELHALGVKTDAGKTLSTAMVSGFLRFIGDSIESKTNVLPAMFGAVEKGATWGQKTVATQFRYSTGSVDTAPKKKRNNRWNPGKALPEELRNEVARLYLKEEKKLAEIAGLLGVHPRRISSYCALLSGLDVPPGEITSYIDDEGRDISVCPPAYAHGAYPQRNVGMKGGS